jgi:hypothetical protein
LLPELISSLLRAGGDARVKIAAFQAADELRVGVVDEKRQTISAFDLPISKASEGVLGACRS